MRAIGPAFVFDKSSKECKLALGPDRSKGTVFVPESRLGSSDFPQPDRSIVANRPNALIESNFPQMYASAV